MQMVRIDAGQSERKVITKFIGFGVEAIVFPKTGFKILYN